ncbi:MAG: YjzC family protein [Proteiniphilum sp.]|nr:YjzC family protein [Proteiniphilum sp.]
MHPPPFIDIVYLQVSLERTSSVVGDLPKPKVVKIEPGDRLPPTSKPGNKWKHK